MTKDSELMHIILADDDEDDRNFFKQAIKELDLNTKLSVFGTGDGLLDYLESLDSDLPHILFLDLNMPCRIENDCLKEIRNNSNLKNLTVAIYSTSNSDKDIHKTFIGGANVYIHKPSDFEVLKDVIREVLKVNWQFHSSGLNKETFIFQI